MRALAGVLAGLISLGIVAACGGAGSPGPVQVTPGVTAAPATSAPTSAPGAVTPAPGQTAGSDYGY
jgi:hypothetical protein